VTSRLRTPEHQPDPHTPKSPRVRAETELKPQTPTGITSPHATTSSSLRRTARPPEQAAPRRPERLNRETRPRESKLRASVRLQRRETETVAERERGGARCGSGHSPGELAAAQRREEASSSRRGGSLSSRLPRGAGAGKDGRGRREPRAMRRAE